MLPTRNRVADCAERKGGRRPRWKLSAIHLLLHTTDKMANSWTSESDRTMGFGCVCARARCVCKMQTVAICLGRMHTVKIITSAECVRKLLLFIIIFIYGIWWNTNNYYYYFLIRKHLPAPFLWASDKTTIYFHVYICARLVCAITIIGCPWLGSRLTHNNVRLNHAPSANVHHKRAGYVCVCRVPNALQFTTIKRNKP